MDSIWQALYKQKLLSTKKMSLNHESFIANGFCLKIDVLPKDFQIYASKLDRSQIDFLHSELIYHFRQIQCWTHASFKRQVTVITSRQRTVGGYNPPISCWTYKLRIPSDEYAPFIFTGTGSDFFKARNMNVTELCAFEDQLQLWLPGKSFLS